MSASSDSFREDKFIPLIMTSPKLGLSNAPIMFSSVVLPLPDGPTIETNSPFVIEILIFFKTASLPAGVLNILDTFLTCNTNDLLSLTICLVSGWSLKLLIYQLYFHVIYSFI